MYPADIGRIPDSHRHFASDSFHPASRLIKKWQPALPIQATYRFKDLRTIASRGDEQGTDFLKQYFANPRFSSDLKKRDRNGCTLICAAAQSGDAERVEMLLSKGVNPNGCNGYETPLHTAVRNQNVRMVEVLLSGEDGGKKADAKARNGDRQTPLEFAKQKLEEGPTKEKLCDLLRNAENSQTLRDRLRRWFYALGNFWQRLTRARY